MGASCLFAPRTTAAGSLRGPHALACAALLPDQVVGAVTFAGIAPCTEEFDWYAGMAAPGGLRSATAGREARARFAETDVFDESSFTPADWAALQGAWSSLGSDAAQADRAGPDGLIDDDDAFVHAWGFELSQIQAPVLLVQGGEDRIVPRSHAEWMLRQIPTAELWLRPREGHVSVLCTAPVAEGDPRGTARQGSLTHDRPVTGRLLSLVPLQWSSVGAKT